MLLHGYAQISTQAINLCVDHDVPIHWLSTTGRHMACLTTTAGQVQPRVRQYRALADEETCLRLARALAAAKVEGQHRYLLRASRQDEATRQAMAQDLLLIQDALQSIPSAPDRDSLRDFDYDADRR